MRRHLLVGLAISMLGLVAQSPAGASDGACANEALRSELSSGQLPDCRAYELVSPSYSEGTLITDTYATSSDGSRMIVGSLGTFAGTEQLALSLGSRVAGAAYLFLRTLTGWVPASLYPPASRYHSYGMSDASVDLETSLWELSSREQAPEVSDFYRASAGHIYAGGTHDALAKHAEQRRLHLPRRSRRSIARLILSRPGLRLSLAV